MTLNKGETLGMFIAGTLVGVAVGLLCAPQSGARTRKQISKRARRSLEHLDDIRSDIQSQVNGWVDDVADTLDEGLNRGRRITSLGQEKVLGVFDEAKHYVDQGRSRIERLIGTRE